MNWVTLLAVSLTTINCMSIISKRQIKSITTTPSPKSDQQESLSEMNLGKTSQTKTLPKEATLELNKLDDTELKNLIELMKILKTDEKLLKVAEEIRLKRSPNHSFFHFGVIGKFLSRVY